MGLIFLGDLHLDNYKSFSTILPSGINSRLLDQINVIRDIGKIIKKQKPTAVIFLGDLYNGISESLPKIIYNAGFLTAKTWSENTQVYFIVGNHDIYRGMHVLSTFESLPNVHIISQTTKVKLDGYEIDMIPWNNPLPKEKGDICAAHLEVQGTWMDANKSHKCDRGIFPTDLFGYRYVFLGHFHTPQEIEVPGTTNAQYIGSVMQMDLRRSHEGFMGIIRLDEGIAGLSIDSPRIRILTIDSQKDADDLKEHFVKELPYDYYKIIITKENIGFDMDSNHFIVEYNLPEVTTSRLGLESAQQINLQQIVETYIDSANIALNKNKVKEVAKEILCSL